MKRLSIVLCGLCALLLAVVPATAQDNPPLGPGEGAPIVAGNFGGDIATTNPILVNDGSSQAVVNRLFPFFIRADFETGLPAANAPQSLATGWEFNEDGTVLTVTLRDDYSWNDGTPVTSADIKYAYDAIVSGDVDTPLAASLASITGVEAPDPQTVVITFESQNCDAVLDASNIPVVPAHHYQTIYPSFADMNTENPANLTPEVSAGPFQFANFRAGEQVTLLADQNFPDSETGHVVPEGFVYKNVSDQLIELEQFIAGQLTYVTAVTEDRQEEIEERAAAGEFQYYETPSTGWLTLLFNLADPANPQPGLDEEGNVVEQTPHPILSDLRVRQALVQSFDFDALNAGAFANQNVPVGGTMLPQSWAYNDALQPYPFDLEAAKALLDEAGFVDDDGNIDTPRVATEDALYAEPGTPLEISLTSFTGNLSIDAATVLMQDQLKQAGFKVNLDIIEFTPMLDKLVGQTYDMLLVFWGVTNVRPAEMYDQLSIEADVPGAGFNTGSWHNPEFDDLMNQARALEGCDEAERKALYDRAQEIVYNEIPRYYVSTSLVPIVVQNAVVDFAPRRNSVFWNEPAWSIQR